MVQLGDGHGNLGPSRLYAIPNIAGDAQRVADAAVGDFNNDGNPDVVAISTGPTCTCGVTGSVWVLLNDGTGILTVPALPVGQMRVGYGSSPVGRVVTSDLDNDRNIDILVLSQINQFQDFPAVTILYGNGNGTFAATVGMKFAKDASGRQISNESQGITTADLNRDGLPDLIVGSYVYRLGGGSVTVWINSGSRNFAAPVSYQSLRQSGFPSVGDLNDDGAPDVTVVSNPDGGIAYFLNDGLGGLGTANYMFRLPVPVVLDIADLNSSGPGTLDLIFGSYAPGASSELGVSLILNGTPRPSNRPPTANAGPDQRVECTGGRTSVTLNGTGSSDPDGDTLTYSWSGDLGTASGPMPSFSCALGTFNMTLTVNDGKGGTSSDGVYISVVDTTPPVIASVAATPNVLWPPNHKMVPVTVSVSASDVCDASVSCSITSVSSNEPINGLGDGDTAPDWVITGALTVDLRAERSGTGTGRVYTITVTCSDGSGNSSTKTVMVTVPHDQRK